MTDRWQKFTDVFLDQEVLNFLAGHADEFLVHGVDVEGKKYILKLISSFYLPEVFFMINLATNLDHLAFVGVNS